MTTSAPLVLVATTGTRGDMLPFMALAQWLRARGHRVRLLVPRFHRRLVEPLGIDHQTFGTEAEFQAALDDPDLWDERKGFSVVWKGAEPHLGDLRDVVAREPAAERCVLLCHPLFVPLAGIARSVRPDLRVVAAYLAPSNLCSMGDLRTLGSMPVPGWLPSRARRLLWTLVNRWWIDPVMLPALNRARVANGLRAVSSFFGHMLQSPDASIGLFPAWFAPPQADWPASFVPGNFPCAVKADVSPVPPTPALERFLCAGPAPIAFTPGTGHRHAARYFSVALQTLKRLGRRGLFITPHAAQVPPDLPADVLWVAEAPFGPLLPRLAALVHHGGIGTTAQAFGAGIPQLIVPFAFDQFDNALRARDLGVAEVLPARRLTVRRMQRGLERLLSSSAVARACEDVAARLAADGPGHAELIDRLESALDLQAAAATAAAANAGL